MPALYTNRDLGIYKLLRTLVNRTQFGIGYYFSGDGAYRNKDGFYRITGRMDDVINVSGHRLGTAEVEDVLVSIFC